MTVYIEVSCDALGCNKIIEIDELDDNELVFNGWHIDPNDHAQHYCPECWKVIKRHSREDKDETIKPKS